jgi:hypothetical protein
MFISKAEKSRIKEEINALGDTVSATVKATALISEIQDEAISKLDFVSEKLVEAYTLMSRLNRRLSKLEGVAPIKTVHTNKTKWTPERRAAQSELLKQKWADKKAAKDAGSKPV